MMIARLSVRAGSLTSPAITAQSSMPVNAKAIDAHRLRSESFPARGTRAASENSLAGPRVMSTYAARPTSSTPGRYAATAPAFCSHLPVPTPTMLSSAASQSSTRVAGRR